MKKVLAAVLIGLAVGSALFAAEDGKMEMYAKATIGYGGAAAVMKGTVSATDAAGETASNPYGPYTFLINGFEITPAFGIGMPFSVDQNWGAIKFAVEAQVPIILGSGGYSGDFAFAIKPGAMFMANYYFPSNFPEWLQKLSPHAGTGFSIPIGSWSYKHTLGSGDDKIEYQEAAAGAGFCWDLLMGVQFDFNEHISAVIDWNQAIGGTYGGSFRAGAIWRF